MKLVLFVVFVLPFVVCAQTPFTSVHGGVAYNAASDVADPYGSIRVGANTKRLQFGGALDFSFGKERRQYYYTDTSGVQTMYKVQHTTFGISPNAFANYKLPIGKSYFYAGADLGLYYYPVTSYTLVRFPRETDYLPMRHIKYMLNAVLGTQAGFSLYLSRSFDLNVELAARYVPTPGKDIVYFPLSFGFRFKPSKHIKTDKEEQPKEIK